MLTVRFPSGVAIVYNSASHVRYRENGDFEIYTRSPEKGGFWAATIQASAGAVVEVMAACSVSNPLQLPELELMVNAIIQRRNPTYSEIRQLARLKRELRRFDVNLRRWK